MLVKKHKELYILVEKDKNWRPYVIVCTKSGTKINRLCGNVNSWRSLPKIATSALNELQQMKNKLPRIGARDEAFEDELIQKWLKADTPKL